MSLLSSHSGSESSMLQVVCDHLTGEWKDPSGEFVIARASCAQIGSRGADGVDSIFREIHDVGTGHSSGGSTGGHGK